MMSQRGNTPSPSSVEVFKYESQYLRGNIGQELNDDNKFFGKSSIQLLKHHGIYEQDDRDVRGQIRDDGSKKRFIYMLRTRIPGGALTSAQLLAELDLCDAVGNSTLRITSRQGLQLHGIVKADLHQTLKKINDTQLTTFAACGDVARNTMCCPAPHDDTQHREIQQLAQSIAKCLQPQTNAYHELWLTDTDTGEKSLAGGESTTTSSLCRYAGDATEPLYGKQYLPRKFKIGVVLPNDNCIDVYTHDIGLIAVLDSDAITGYNILVGGGQSRTPSAKKTFVALGQKLGYVIKDRVIDVVQAIVKVQRDHGNRSDRKIARLKYLIHDWGLDKFRETVEEYLGESLAAADPTDVTGHDDHMGWYAQGDGKWFYGLNIENGRIKNTNTCKLKSALRAICQQFKPHIHLTAHQSLIFSDISESDKSEIENILISHRVPLSDDFSNARRWSMACVAWPTCGLSITESERALPGMIDQLEHELETLGLAQERFTLRMTGCPNGCARPYNSDIGLVGRAQNKYTLFVGGALLGNRLAFIHRDMVPTDQVVPLIVKLFEFFKTDREGKESFGDFCSRKGNASLLAYTESNIQ